MNDRGYIKRIYRVPKDRGAVECLQSLILKKLVQHGWPAVAVSGWRAIPWSDDAEQSFAIRHHSLGRDAGPDFWQAVSVACRIVARTYRVDLSENDGLVTLNRYYIVNKHTVFKEVAPDVSSYAE